MRRRTGLNYGPGTLSSRAARIASVVFFGSEGKLGVVAADFADLLWLLAGGFGPLEAVDDPRDRRAEDADFTSLALQYAGGARKSAHDVIAAASLAYPSFVDEIRKRCR